MTNALKVENLRMEFGGLVAVKDVSFELGEGEFVGLIGPNGCGKSTIFNCISGLLDQTTGTVEVFGQDVSENRPDEIQKLGLTRTFQLTRLWRQMTVVENLMVPPRKQFLSPESEAPMHRAYSLLSVFAVLASLSVVAYYAIGNGVFWSLFNLIAALGLLTGVIAFRLIEGKSEFDAATDRIESAFLPPLFVLHALFRPGSRAAEEERLAKAYSVLDQLEIPHMAHNLTSELSGGQSKLVDIGRSMMGDPQLLLLDEPVAGVAGPLALKIFNNLRKIVDDTGISVLIIEHNMDFILRQGVDRIIVMKEGEILMQGTPDEVRGNRAVIEAYLGAAGEPQEVEE